MAAHYPNALKPNHAFHGKGGGPGVGDGTSGYAARFDDSRLTALGGVTPQAGFTAIKPTTDMTAIGAVFADLAAARTAVNTLRTDAEARLDAIETKLDALRTALIASGVLT